MRKGFASFIMAVSVLAVSTAWAGIVFVDTIADPSASQPLAEVLVDDPAVSAAMSGRLSSALTAKIPTEIAMSAQAVHVAAEVALGQPEIRRAMIDAIATAHADAILEGSLSTPSQTSIEASGETSAESSNSTTIKRPQLRSRELSIASRAALVAERPALDDLMADYPSVGVELPTAGLSWIGAVRSPITDTTRRALVLALVGVATAALVATDRSSLLRRAGVWALGAAAFWAAASAFLPAVISEAAPASTALIAASADLFLAAMAGPSRWMALGGIVLLLGSYGVPVMDRRRGAAKLQPAAPSVIADLRKPNSVVDRPLVEASASNPMPLPFDSPGMRERLVTSPAD